ncbi:hypothetical protein PQX77_011935 [Marasmius sp. AFHP31]|nr:hypothetical protein PQX77_011935 [Marasmius sp. AFHP31]
MTHAFFALMGGFAFDDSEGKILFHLWDDRFCQHTKSRQEGSWQEQQRKLEELSSGDSSSQYSSLLEYCVAKALINVTEEEIQTLGHSDILAKSITLFQTLQFIIKCIGRGGDGLAITELEFLTLGFATLNLVSYSFWWHKPSGAQFLVRVRDRPKPVSPQQPSDSQNQEKESKSHSNGTAPESRTPGVLDAFAHRIRDDYDSLNPLYLILVVPFLAITRLFSYALSADAAPRPQPECGNIFSATTINEKPLTYILSYFTAAVLGVFHCIPIMLNYRHFPGHSKDHHLWTGFALSMTVMPLGVGIAHVVTRLRARERARGSVSLQPLLALIIVLSYATARIALMVLAAKQLTDLPASALQEVEWTDFVPHFGI